MWLVTKDGFYSVVQDRGDPDRLVVRGRWKKHLKVLKDLLPGSRILVTPEADYPYRMFVSREDWEKLLKVIGELSEKEVVAREIKEREDGR
jgi:hypothetical protein